MDQTNNRDDALFEALSKSKKKKKRKTVRTVIIVLLVLAVGLAAGVFFLRRQVAKRFASGKDEAVIIPAETLHQTSSISYVYTSYDEETKEFGGLREVTVGITNSSYAEITSGLQAGETVYYTETEDSFFGGMSFGGGFPGGDGSGGFPGGESGGGGFPGGGSGGGPSGGFPGGGDRPSGGGRG